ncbi:hypothetical protein N7447_008167 [Penicillium robsamsonii]|uniref:uncharacterized protein n=1 Tax=Penicillium robsamsonii TaxID=1792511 RepID=UPI0025466F05|nr:uncharacterized protein N7447_008167 [Penicillium robsamsonii]KAJ5815934.1 hypothetical protein N7447_008167 [Penicillium robsamsonii]
MHVSHVSQVSLAFSAYFALDDALADSMQVNPAEHTQTTATERLDRPDLQNRGRPRRFDWGH